MVTPPPNAPARVLDGPPATLPMMLRAALPAVPVLNHVSGIGKSGSGSSISTHLTGNVVPRS
jgi:hypothetical protein